MGSKDSSHLAIAAMSSAVKNPGIMFLMLFIMLFIFVKEKCDMIASIPMKGDIDSLNASVAAGVLAYEIVRQRLN